MIIDALFVNVSVLQKLSTKLTVFYACFYSLKGFMFFYVHFTLCKYKKQLFQFTFTTFSIFSSYSTYENFSLKFT